MITSLSLLLSIVKCFNTADRDNTEPICAYANSIGLVVLISAASLAKGGRHCTWLTFFGHELCLPLIVLCPIWKLLARLFPPSPDRVTTWWTNEDSKRSWSLIRSPWPICQQADHLGVASQGASRSPTWWSVSKTIKSMMMMMIALIVCIINTWLLFRAHRE